MSLNKGGGSGNEAKRERCGGRVDRTKRGSMVAQFSEQAIAYLSTILSLDTPYSLLCSLDLALNMQSPPFVVWKQVVSSKHGERNAAAQLISSVGAQAAQLTSQR